MAGRLADRLARRARTGERLLRRGNVAAALRCFDEVCAVARALAAIAPADPAPRDTDLAPSAPPTVVPGDDPDAPDGGAPLTPVPLRRALLAASRPVHVEAPPDPAADRSNLPTERVARSSFPSVEVAPEPLGPAPELPPDTIVAGRYRVEARIGTGGMSSVHRVLDLELDERVALKLFAPAAHDDALLVRFKQELCVSRRLAHPNVVHLYDIGTFEGHKFITMELYDGSSLRDLLVRAGRFDPRRAIRVLVQACAGLDTAHRAGVVHRDVKPENLFVTTSGLVKVMDFGIAKRQSDAIDPASARWVVGTPTYMAPEQLASFDDVSPLADVYSLGVVAFELLAGVPPFFAESPLELLLCHSADPPPSLCGRDDGVPAELDAIVQRALAKDPADRPQSCAELAALLLGVLAHLA
jgi:hypothetical protein